MEEKKTISFSLLTAAAATQEGSKGSLSFWRLLEDGRITEYIGACSVDIGPNLCLCRLSRQPAPQLLRKRRQHVPVNAEGMLGIL